MPQEFDCVIVGGESAGAVGPGGPSPTDPREDANLAELAALKAGSQRHMDTWAQTGQGPASSSIHDAVAFASTGLGDAQSHDAQIAFFGMGIGPNTQGLARIDVDTCFDNTSDGLAVDKERFAILANPVLPKSTGDIVLVSADPEAAPVIKFNCFSDPNDLKGMVAVMRRAPEIVDSWPGEPKPGALHVPPFRARKHGVALASVAV